MIVVESEVRAVQAMRDTRQGFNQTGLQCVPAPPDHGSLAMGPGPHPLMANRASPVERKNIGGAVRTMSYHEAAHWRIVGAVIETLNDQSNSKLVLSLPHSGTVVPEWCRTDLLVDPDDLWSDWRTAELYDFATELDVAIVRTRLSRYVADPNRRLAPPLHGDFWTTVVPATLPDGKDTPVYGRRLTDEEIDRRIGAAHRPYHEALDRVVQRALEHNETALLLDLHCFGEDLGVDVVLGNGNGTTATVEQTEVVATAIRNAGFSVALNRRFAGGYIVRRHAPNPRVNAIQIELNQRCYLAPDEVHVFKPRPAVVPDRWEATRGALAQVLEAVV